MIYFPDSTVWNCPPEYHSALRHSTEALAEGVSESVAPLHVTSASSLWVFVSREERMLQSSCRWARWSFPLHPYNMEADWLGWWWGGVLSVFLRFCVGVLEEISGVVTASVYFPLEHRPGKKYWVEAETNRDYLQESVVQQDGLRNALQALGLRLKIETKANEQINWLEKGEKHRGDQKTTT